MPDDDGKRRIIVVVTERLLEGDATEVATEASQSQQYPFDRLQDSHFSCHRNMAVAYEAEMFKNEDVATGSLGGNENEGRISNGLRRLSVQLGGGCV